MNDERVWSYAKKFSELKPFVNRVKASTSSGVFSLPINLLSLFTFFHSALPFCDALNN
jgi:UDP-galactopyranose mutase